MLFSLKIDRDQPMYSEKYEMLPEHIHGQAFWAKGDLCATYMVNLIGFARFIVFDESHDPEWDENSKEES